MTTQLSNEGTRAGGGCLLQDTVFPAMRAHELVAHRKPYKMSAIKLALGSDSTDSLSIRTTSTL